LAEKKGLLGTYLEYLPFVHCLSEEGSKEEGMKEKKLIEGTSCIDVTRDVRGTNRGNEGDTRNVQHVTCWLN